MDRHIEQRLQRALDTTARSQVPDERSLPAAPWTTTGTRPHARIRLWLLPLGAVGATAIVIGVIVARAVRSPAPPSHAATTTRTTDTTDTPVGLIPGVATTPQTAGPGRVRLAGANIIVPNGWRATYAPYRIGGPYTWCLGPQSTCSVMVHRYSPAYVGPFPEMPVSGDTTHVCVQVSLNPLVLKQARTAIFGRRQADYRMWTIQCPDGTRTIAQYVIADPPAFELVTTTTETGVRLEKILAAMDAIARSASLPTTPTGLRMYDQGQVVRAKAAGDGYDIVLRRSFGGSINDWVRTDIVTPYHIPSTLLPPGYPVGQLGREHLALQSDGARVTDVIMPGG